jgi:DNA polymerase kappa
MSVSKQLIGSNKRQRVDSDERSIDYTHNTTISSSSSANIESSTSKQHVFGSTADDMHRMSLFIVQKSGMQDVQMGDINKVVYEMSKDSAHFKNEQARAEKTSQRIASMQKKLHELKQHWKNQPQLERAALVDTERKLDELRTHLDTTRRWIHVDLDMFYAAAELLDMPHLRHVPMCVGGLGMITTSNYIARKFGVRAAMPGFIALKLCPQLQFVKPDFGKYTAIAEKVREIFKDYDPDCEAGMCI